MRLGWTRFRREKKLYLHGLEDIDAKTSNGVTVPKNIPLQLTDANETF
jgi:hypothetical protein